MVAVGQVAVRVFVVMVRVVLHLEQAVHLHDPGHLGPHKGADDGCRHLRVVFWRQFIAQVVQQGRHNGVYVGAVVLGAAGGL